MSDLGKLILSLSVLTIASMFTSPVFAQEITDSEFTKFEGVEIQKNPEAQKILDKIEESKKILEQMMEQAPLVTEQQRFVDEQRRIAEEMLNIDLKRMNKEYEEHTPRNAFASFVSKFNATHHGIYWDQFEHLEEKVVLARAAKQLILDNGGSWEEAHQEYVKYAAMPRIEMIQTIMELNLKYGFAIEGTQVHFDENGKLPRYDNDLDEICYGCLEYEKKRNEMMDIESNPYVQINIVQPVDSKTVFVSQEVTESLSSNTSTEISQTLSELERKMDALGLQMVNEKDFEKQKEIRKAITDVAMDIEKLYSNQNFS